MQTKYRYPLNLQLFAEDGAGEGTPQTVKIGDKDYTVEELSTKLADYGKLEKKMTQVSQENSDLRKTAEAAKEWLDFEKSVAALPADKQQAFIKQTNDFFAAVQAGTVTQQDVSGINKAIKSAEQAGDKKGAEALEGARDEALQTLSFNEQMDELEERADEDGIPFKRREFKTFLIKHLEDEGYTEEDDIGRREIRAAYKLYVAEKKQKSAEEERKRNIPNLGTGGSGVAAGGKSQNDKGPKTVAEATKRLLTGNWGN